MRQAVSAIANHWQFHMSYHAGQRIRAQVMMLVFQKALLVDPQERPWLKNDLKGDSKRPSVGLTLNLMSTDAQKFLEALPFLHKLWASPWHAMEMQSPRP